MLTFENEQELFNYIHELKRQERALQQARIEKAQELKKTMTVEEKISMLNKSYDEIDIELRAGMTKHPQMFNFVHINKPHMEGQHETFGARLTRFMDKYDLDRDSLVNMCNTAAQKFDKPARVGSGRKNVRTRITKNDIKNYLDFNICPKIDKMYVISKALKVPIEYLAGYGEQDVDSRNQILEARYRKGRKKTYVQYIDGTPQKKRHEL